MSVPQLSLPHCYLADLPADAELTAALIRDAWLALQRNREEHLAHRTTQELIQTVEQAAGLWLADDSKYRALALESAPRSSGFSKPVLEDGLRQVFASFRAPALEQWVEQDLGHPNRLDGFCASGPERASGRRARATGPDSLAQVTAGNLPASALLSMVAGILLRSAQFIKCATGASLVPRLFAHSLREIDPHLGACIEVAEWSHTRSDLQTALLEPAACITATGTDAAVSALREAAPATARFVAYGHKLSFAFIAAEALEPADLEEVIAGATRDVCAWDQQGCLSPHVLYVENGGKITAEAFAETLAGALEAFEASSPRGPISQSEGITIRSRRGFYEVRAAHSPDTRLWQSPSSTAWTLVYEADPLFQPSCLNRFVYVKAADSLRAVLEAADAVRHQVSTVGLAAPAARLTDLAARLARWGVTRICPIGRMQQPPVPWRHDGRPSLGDLVRWTDWEGV